MPAKKKRNNKLKSAKTMMNQNLTIHHSSPTFQHQEEEKHLRAFSMEDEAKEVVVVESVKALEIADDDNNDNNIISNNPEPEPEPEPVTESKRDISILEEIIDKAEKILDREEDSSSSSDDEKEAAAVECEPEKEEKVEPSLVIDATPSVAEDPIPTVETELEKPSSAENEGSVDEPKGTEQEEEAVLSSSSPVINIVDQTTDEVEENIGEESKVVVPEVPIENLDTSNPNAPSDEAAVNKDSLQASSSPWKSCCGLFELIRL